MTSRYEESINPTSFAASRLPIEEKENNQTAQSAVTLVSCLPNKFDKREMQKVCELLENSLAE
jgi:hypothetical protein